MSNPNDYTSGQTFKAGDRVELHPGTDEWMKGNRYGTVLSVWGDNAYWVKTDKRRKRLIVPTDRLRRAE